MLPDPAESLLSSFTESLGLALPVLIWSLLSDGKAFLLRCLYFPLLPILALPSLLPMCVTCFPEMLPVSSPSFITVAFQHFLVCQDSRVCLPLPPVTSTGSADPQAVPAKEGYGEAEHSHPGSRKASAQPLGNRQEMNMSGHRKGGVLVVCRALSEAPLGLWKSADCSTVSLFHPLRVISFGVPMK